MTSQHKPAPTAEHFTPLPDSNARLERYRPVKPLWRMVELVVTVRWWTGRLIMSR